MKKSYFLICLVNLVSGCSMQLPYEAEGLIDRIEIASASIPMANKPVEIIAYVTESSDAQYKEIVANLDNVNKFISIKAKMTKFNYPFGGQRNNPTGIIQRQCKTIFVPTLTGTYLIEATHSFSISSKPGASLSIEVR